MGQRVDMPSGKPRGNLGGEGYFCGSICFLRMLKPSGNYLFALLLIRLDEREPALP